MSWSPSLRSTIEPNEKKPPKIRFIKFVKLTGYTYAYNSLTNYEYEGHAMTGNGNDLNLLISPYKISNTDASELISGEF